MTRNITRWEDTLPDLGKLKRPRKVAVPESMIVNACIRWLLAHGCFVWRNNTGAMRPEGSNRPIHYGKIGSPDIIGMTSSGRFIGVECKSGKNKLSHHQETFRDQMQEHNGIHVVAYSTDDLENRKGEII